MISIADWIVAAGTGVLALVAILAIFQDRIRMWFLRPRLQIEVNVRPPDCHKTKMHIRYEYRGGASVLPSDPREMRTEQIVDTYYFRLRISNVGNVKAESVEVFAADLSRLQADESYSAVDSFLPMNLVWSHYRNVFLPAISPGTYKHCDIGHVIDPKRRSAIPGEDRTWPNVDASDAIFSFDTAVQPFTLSYLIPPGKYRLSLIIAASNADPVRKALEINVTGHWFKDEREMLSNGIGIRIIE